MKKIIITAVILSSFILAGCSGMTNREKAIYTGSAIGAGLMGGVPAVTALAGGAIAHDLTKDEQPKQME